MYTGRGDTAHTLFIGGTIDVGTPHNIERQDRAKCGKGTNYMGGKRLKKSIWSVGWVVGFLSVNISTFWFHLASWGMPEFQLK